MRVLRLGPALAAIFMISSGVAVSAAPMTFKLVDFGDKSACAGGCPQVIAADGEINSRTPQAFADFVGRHIGSGRLHSIVLLNSQGGQVVAAMELGQAFRRIGAAAVVARVGEGGSGRGGHVLSGRCYSACVYALMGAKKRVSPPQSRVGIHRMFMYEAERRPDTQSNVTRIFATEPLVARLGEYAQMMGVSNELVWKAETVDPDRIHIISAKEMRRWKLASPNF